MDEVITQILSLAEQLALLEAGLAGGPRPERLAWLELDAAGAITRVSALALERLGLGADIAAGTPLGMLADTKGDVLVDGVLVLTTAAGPITALSVGDGAGRTIVLGGSNTDAAGDTHDPCASSFTTCRMSSASCADARNSPQCRATMTASSGP